MKALKKLLIIFLSFTVLVTGALWILSKTTSPSVIKDYVAGQLASISSRECQIDGDIKWAIFPQPGLRIAKIKVGGSATDSQYSLAIDNLFLNLKITPLLRGQLVFSFLKIDGFNLRINADSVPQVTLKKADTQTPNANKLAGQFAIERFLAGNGQISILKNAHLVKWSDLQMGAEQINSQQTLFPFQLKSDMAYTQPGLTAATAQIQFKGTGNLSTALLSDPFQAIKSMQINGQLIAKHVQISKFKIDRLSAHTTFKNSMLRFSPLTFELYHGQSVGTLQLDLPQHHLEMNLTASNLNSLGLTRDLFSKKLLRGKLDLSLHMQTSLQSANWLDASTVKGNISIRDGNLESISLSRIVDTTSSKIDQFLSAVSSRKIPHVHDNFAEIASDPSGQTPFTLLTMKYRLEQNMLFADHLYLQTSNLQLEGKGQLNLKDNTLASQLKTTITAAQPKLAKVQELLGGSFPITISGSVDKLMILPDLKIINPILTGLIIKEALKKPVMNIRKQLNSAFLEHHAGE